MSQPSFAQQLQQLIAEVRDMAPAVSDVHEQIAWRLAEVQRANAEVHRINSLFLRDFKHLLPQQQAPAMPYQQDAGSAMAQLRSQLTGE